VRICFSLFTGGGEAWRPQVTPRQQLPSSVVLSDNENPPAFKGQVEWFKGGGFSGGTLSNSYSIKCQIKPRTPITYRSVATFVLVAQNLRVGSEATKGRSEWIVLESQFKCPAGCTRRWHTKIGGTQGGPNPVIKDLEHSIWEYSPLNSLKLKGN